MTPTTSPSFFSTLIPDWEDEDDYPDIPNPTGAALNHVNDDDDNHSDDTELLSDLEPRERDDDDSSDPDMPSLLARDEMDSDCDSDNSPPEPPPRQNNNQGRNANNANRPAPRRNQRVAPAERSDHDSSSDGLPELISRIPVAPRSRGNDSSSDSSIPGLVTASNKASEPIVSNRGSEPASRLARRTARNKEETMKKEQPIKQMQEKATSRQAIRASRINEEKDNAKKMKVKQLKKQLQDMGFSTASYVEKADLVDALAIAIVDREMNDTKPRPAEPALNPYADLPSLVPAHDPPKNGCWILVSVAGINTKSVLKYVFPEGSTLKIRSFGQFHADSLLSRRLDASVMVLSPPGLTARADKWEMICVKETGLKVKTYDVDRATQIVSDGRHGVWALCGNGTSRAKQHFLELGHVAAHGPNGRNICLNIPDSAKLFMSRSGGVWLHIPNEGVNTWAMQPGLWYLTREKSKRVVAKLKTSALLASDATLEGMWVAEPSDQNKETTMLTHWSVDGDQLRQEIAADFLRLQAIVRTQDTETVYLHYKSRDRWRLCSASLGQRTVKEIVECPRHSQIYSCGMGGVWVWKRIGRTGQYAVMYIDCNGTIQELFSERFRNGCVIASL